MIEECVLGIRSFNEEDKKRYSYIFEYLSKIRLSDYFVGQGALWGFIEHYWAPDKEKTGLNKSVKSLIEYLYPSPECRQLQQELNRKIRAVGSKLGKEYNEGSLRNILAHGKHFTLREGWDDDCWVAFYDMSDHLMDIVVRALHKEIVEFGLK